MKVRLKFLGAARSVTGSKYLLEIDNKKILIDCGLFQGQKELRLRNWESLPVDPATIQTVIITHAHIDHIGYLPRLVKDGFHGRILCTHATEDLMKIMLRDAAKLQEEEAQFAFKKGYSKHAKPQPLFTIEDAERVLTLVDSIRFEKETKVLQNVSVTYYNAGHILGSAIAELKLATSDHTKKIIFSGDLGRYDDPIMYPPKAITEADILIVESTYGDRLNPMEQVEADLTQIVNEAVAHEGTILVPAFAVGRTQILIYYFHLLMEQKVIPMLPIYIDSPMAIDVTDLYEKHSNNHKIKVEHIEGRLVSIFDTPNIHFCNTRESSKALNEIKTPAIIISASGMATGGRVLHHLFHRLRRENDTVLLAGYQAEGSRGRRIQDGEPIVKIFGEEVPVRCHVKTIHGLSAHADQNELLQWLSNFKQSPKRVFITHGEIESTTTLAGKIEAMGWETIIPEYLESFDLFNGI
ncbi:MAG TPA: MBL fold metallo-hydrolase [Cyclobacteriaceae bacterium]|nr:MBL fold metallo-hydrolase [Cyclobacteriaceae bacterium]